MSLRDEDREWIAYMLADVFSPYGRDFDPAEGARLIEARMETLLNRTRAAAWDEGASSRQCHCAATCEHECACGMYPNDRNPYREI